MPPMKRILILDDEPDMLEGLRRVLGSSGHDCIAVSDPGEALELLRSRSPDVFLTDLRMPNMDGFELLRRAREIDSELPIVVLTAFATIESAVAAIKEGASDYLAKPFSIDQLKMVVGRALRRRRPVAAVAPPQRTAAKNGFENILGQSPALLEALALARKAAQSEANVLIVGESGTGKELVARAIHSASGRCEGAFIPVDCASLPENLLESELFGHEKGAFTGAVASKPGLAELAHQGTLFLDEIAELSIALQAKLLRVLQERQIRRVGGTRQIDVDIRVLSATHVDLKSRIQKGEFREDLFYRINVIDIRMPALRERRGDLSFLAGVFLDKYGRKSDRALRGFEPEALAALETYSWPGNVRELQNVIQRACALADGDTVTVGDLPTHIRSGNSAAPAVLPDGPRQPLSLREAKARWLAPLEASYLREVLRQQGGNVSRAARVLEVDRKTLHRLLAKHGLR
jgi:DNA-binding NtrC family response regulator